MTTPDPPAPPPSGPPTTRLSTYDDSSLAELRKQFTAEQWEKTKSYVTMFCSAEGGSSLRAVAITADQQQSRSRSMSVLNEAPPQKTAAKGPKRDRVAAVRDMDDASRPASAPLPASIVIPERPRISLSDAAERFSQKERDRRKEKKRRLGEQVGAHPHRHQFEGPSIKVEPPSYSPNPFSMPPPQIRRTESESAMYSHYPTDSTVYPRPASMLERFMEEQERRAAASRPDLLRPTSSYDDDDEFSPAPESESPTPSPLPQYIQGPPFPFAYPTQPSNLFPPASHSYSSHAHPGHAHAITPQKHIKSIPPTSSPYHPDQLTPAPFPIPSGPRPNQKPSWSYAALIGQAICAAPSKRASLSQIYNWISSAYPYYKRSEAGWQNSIRHNLSLNECFIKIKREEGEKGKGCWWGIRAGDEECFAGGGFRKKGSSTARSQPAPAPTRRASAEIGQKRKSTVESEDEDEPIALAPPPAKRPAPIPPRSAPTDEHIVYAVPQYAAPPQYAPPPQADMTLPPPQLQSSQTPTRANSPLPPLAKHFADMPGLTPSVSSPLGSSPPHQSMGPPPKPFSALQPSFQLSPLRKESDRSFPSFPRPRSSDRGEFFNQPPASPASFLRPAAFKEHRQEHAAGLSLSMPFPKLQYPQQSSTRPRTPPSKMLEILSNSSSAREDRRLPSLPLTEAGLRTPPPRSRLPSNSTPLFTPLANPVTPARAEASRTTPGLGTPFSQFLAANWDMSDPAMQANEDLQSFVQSGVKLGLFESPVRGGRGALWDSPGVSSWY